MNDYIISNDLNFGSFPKSQNLMNINIIYQDNDGKKLFKIYLYFIKMWFKKIKKNQLVFKYIYFNKFKF